MPMDGRIDKCSCMIDTSTLTAMEGGNANRLSGTIFAHGGRILWTHGCVETGHVQDGCWLGNWFCIAQKRLLLALH